MDEISYKLNAEELYYGMVDVAKTRLITKIFKILSMVLLGAMAFVTVVTMKSGSFNITTGYVITIVLALYGYFLPEISAKVQVPTIVKNKAPLSQQLKLNFYKTYFSLSGETFNHKINYQKLHSVVETDDFILLKTAEGSADILPKRAFSTDQLLKFKSILGAVEGLKVKLK
ncbi:YcxB family protein [Dyadobacter arcticus]|uniref:YcxB-like C-terminal domain-containing protein n=1 Tax=Dyadobacter arcticus TaxID=1078754 RepID=A0ABX0UP34_9BACT|nr:YcxB family protein [Dyadobacter arcticus]NIJ54753.1 hypothetical protein [Dyadobacter arcticus]